MIRAIRNLPLQVAPPSSCVCPGLLDGLDKIW